MDNSYIITNIEKELKNAETMLELIERQTIRLKKEIETKKAILKALKGE